MARPPKTQRVDYFPHMCTHHGKTIYILEQRYREKGYTFWFKLLEKLGSTTGHALDLTDQAEWELLQARSFCDAATCEDILGLLVRLNAIDKDLWEQRRIVWCQNFVDNLADVYRKRNCQIPSPPVVSAPETTGQRGFLGRKLDHSGVSDPESAARIGQDRTGEERTGNAHEVNLTYTTQNTLELVKAVYPEAGLKIGLEDGSAAEAIDEIMPSEHGQVVIAARNYAAEIASNGTAPQFVKQLTNFLRCSADHPRGFWRNYVSVKPLGGNGPPGQPVNSFAEQDLDRKIAEEEREKRKRGELPPLKRPKPFACKDL